MQVFSRCCLGNNRLAALHTLKVNGSSGLSPVALGCCLTSTSCVYVYVYGAGNAFGVDGSRHLADALTAQRVRQRDLQTATAVASFGGLRRLELSGNRIGDEGEGGGVCVYALEVS